MKNLGQLMKQAQEMQEKMAEVQAQLEAVELTGVAGGGMVKVTLNGKGDVRAIKIDKAAIDPEEGEVLEDLLVAAFSDARAKVNAQLIFFVDKSSPVSFDRDHEHASGGKT